MTVVESIRNFTGANPAQLQLPGMETPAASVMSKISSKIPAMPNFMKGSVEDTVIFQKAAGLAEKGIAKVAEGAAEGSFKAGFASKASTFLGQMGKVAKGIPIVAVAINTLFEIPAVIEGFKEGRGLAQIMKSGAAVSGTTIGSIVGAALGTLVPIPAVGTWVGGAVGAMVGNWAGNKIGGGLFGNNHGNAKMADAYQMQRQQRPAQFGQMTAPYSAHSPMVFDINNPLAGLPPLV